MKRIFLFSFLVLSVNLVFAQDITDSIPTQTVRGKVVDVETKSPLPGVKIILISTDSSAIYRVLSDVEGYYVLRKVKIGKYNLTATLSTYDTKSTTIEVNSGKESIVDFGMGEAFVEQAEVIVTARKKGEVINEMALISAQQFSVEETNRYAGSRSDPARMASNFAGVQGADDSRNDIIIRGNSPLGVVWKVEGIDIPNPSHFATSGSTGGPVSVLNNKILANSDFFMSAFPAEYGNSVSGVFDLKLRNGNNQNHEFTGQFGILGTEVLAEGPLNREKKSSYLVMGRYSTLSMFQKIGVKIGTDAVPVYGDAAFKFNWNLKNGGNLSFFGIGGKSKIEILISDQKELSDELYGEGDRDQYFGTSMATTGFVYKKTLNEKTFLSSTLALNYDEQHSKHIYLYRSLDTTNTNGQQRVAVNVDSTKSLLGYYFKTTRLSYYLGINHKINRRQVLKAGINIDGYYFDQLDSVANSDFF
ncbi:MAG: carboxypeptidase-like regulatory domain-containing protein [Bacteroidetes bacterium]|nr:carboxypeptidase-like regulatory domain-containing protein [Bacteroidota bacterium]